MALYYHRNESQLPNCAVVLSPVAIETEPFDRIKTVKQAGGCIVYIMVIPAVF